MALRNELNAWSWGRNNSGQLGLGNVANQTVPMRVDLTTWRAMAAGDYHSFGLRANGGLWSWGSNDFGELGQGVGALRDTVPHQVGSDLWRLVEGGANFSVGVQADGSLWSWGRNSYGQLGQGDTVRLAAPQALAAVAGQQWNTVCAGTSHVLGVARDSSLWGWGRSNAGQLGLGNTTNQSVPTAVGIDHWLRVACGGSHSLAIRADSSLWGWGLNTSGQLGTGDTARQTAPVQVGSDHWLQVAAGTNFSLGLRADSTLWAWGLNSSGQLGKGDTLRSSAPVQVGSGKWSAVVAGSSHAVAQAADGTLWSWGLDNYGQLGNGATAAQYAPISLVLKMRQTITFTTAATRRLDLSPFAVSGTTNAGQPVTFGTTTPTICMVTSDSVRLLHSGNCTITADAAGNGDYLAATRVSRIVTVDLGNQSITFGALADRTFGDSTIALAATASSGLGVLFDTPTSDICQITGSTLTLVGAGTCTITVDQYGDADWNAATQVSRSFSVAKAAQVITFGSLTNHIYGDEGFAATPTATSGLEVDVASLTPTICTVVSGWVSSVGVGTCTLRATQPGDTSWLAAANVDRSFIIARASQEIVPDGLSDCTYGEGPFPLVATATSALPVSWQSTTPSVCAAVGDSLEILTAGSCTVRADQVGDSLWQAAAQVSQTLAVAKAPQSITPTAVTGSLTFGNAPFAVTATATSGLAVVFTSETREVCTVAGTIVTLVGGGGCSLLLNQGGDANRDVAPPENLYFDVLPADQSITAPSLADRASDAAPQRLVSTATSGLPVTIASVTGDICDLSGDTLKVYAAGSCSLTFDQEGNLSWNAAAQVSRSFTVEEAVFIASINGSRAPMLRWQAGALVASQGMQVRILRVDGDVAVWLDLDRQVPIVLRLAPGVYVAEGAGAATLRFVVAR
jgi:alpha-tubulin suppressor-like RCC1 family protein